MAKKIWEMMQEDIERNKQASENLQREANEKFNNLVSQKGAYDTSKHTSNVKNITNAYKQTSKTSANNFKKANKLTLWDSVMNIAKGFKNTTDRYANNIMKNPYDKINTLRDNSEQALDNRAKENNMDANFIINVQNNAKAYNEAIKKYQNEQIKNTVEYQNQKQLNTNMSENSLIEKAKEKMENTENNFDEYFKNLSKTERSQEINKIRQILSNKDGLFETEEQKNKNKKIINDLILESEVIDAEKKAEKVNKTLNEGNFIQRATTATGELASSMGKSAMDMTISPALTVGSLAEEILPTRDFKGPKFDEVIDYKRIQDYADAVKNENIELKLLKTGKGISSTIGGMIPSIIANIAVPGSNVGMITQASGVAGTDYIENLNENKTNKVRSVLSGTLKGLGSYATGKITGGNILGKGSLDDWATKTIANKTSNKITQKIASKIYEVGGENFEELLENQIDHIVDATVNNKGVSFKDWLNEQSETVKQTTLTQVFLNLMGIGGNTYSEVQEYKNNAEAKEWLNEAQKIIDKENLSIDNLQISDKNINEVRNALNNLSLESNTLNSQQNTTINQNNQSTQQTIQEINKTAQNGNIGQIKVDSENFARQVDEVKNGTFPQKDMLTIGKTPQVLKEIGLPDLPITMTQKHLDTIMNESGRYKDANYHNLGEDIVKQLPEAINNPLDIVKSNTKDDSIVLTTYLADKQDRPVIASIKIDGKGRVNDIIIDSNVMTSAYGRNNYDKFMQDNIKNGNLLYDIDRGVIKKVTEARLQLPRVGNFPTIDGSSITNSILATQQNVNSNTTNNYSIQDNEKYSLPTQETLKEASINLPQNPNAKKVKFDNENLIQESNKMSDEETAQILTEIKGKTNEKRKMSAFLKANLIDKGMIFEELSRKTNNRDLQGKYDYTLTAEARGQNAIGNARYDYQTITKNGKIKKGEKNAKRISKSLTEIIDEVGENPADFYNYMYHQLNIDRMTLEERFGGDTGINYERKNTIKNKPVFGKGITAEISQKYVQKLEQKHPEFKGYAQDVYDFLDANTKELVDNGVISKETQQLFKEMYPHYVPISRVTNKGQAINVPLDTGRTGVNSPIKRAKGGNGDINPLFQTMADRTLQTYRASARNNFGIELKNTLNKAKQLNQITELTDIDSIMESMTDEEQNNNLLQEGINGGNPTFTVFENGEKVTYEISKDMYDALKPKNELLKRFDNSALSKGLNKVNNFRRGLLTEYNPVFSITNAIKDAQDVLLNSQHSARTYSKIPEATAQIVSKGYWYKEYIQNGGEQNSYFRDGEFEATKKTLPTKAKEVVKLPLKAISNVNNVIEMTPRLAEYIVSRQQGKSIETSMLDASRVTTNFKAGGDITKTLNRNGFTFLNASVQGMQQQIRNIQEANAKGLKGYAVLATKYAIAGLPVLILNNLIWNDDEEYEELQDYVKDNYYIIGKTENGTFIRIPKGRAVATIQKIVSNANDFIKNDKINSDDVGEVFWNDLKDNISFARDNLAPNNPLDNNVIAPITQVISNKTWYGDALVPTRLQDKPKEEQYDETTDEISKWIGKHLKVSPMKANYLLDQYSGGVGDIILPKLTPQAENSVVEDKFTTNPIMKNKYPGEFFEKIDELTVNKNSDKATDEDKIKYQYMSSVQSEMSDLYKEKREIQNSKTTDEVKKKQLEKVQEKINNLAKNSLEKVEKITKGTNYAQIDSTQYYKDIEGEWKKVSEKDKKKNKESGLSLKTYSSYKYETSKIKQEKVNKGEMTKEQSLKDNEQIQILLDSSYTDKEKSIIYEDYIKSSVKEGEYDSFKVIKASGININEYLKYEQQEFKSDKKDDGTLNGKTVSKSKQKKVENYLNSMNIDGNQRLLLYAMQGYSTTNSQKTQLANYVYELDLEPSTKLELYNKFSGFKVYKDGRVKW